MAQGRAKVLEEEATKKTNAARRVARLARNASLEVSSLTAEVREVKNELARAAAYAIVCCVGAWQRVTVAG